MIRVLGVVPIVVLLLAGCAGGVDPSATPTATPGLGGGVHVGDEGNGPQNDDGDEDDDDSGEGDDDATPESWAFGPVQIHTIFHAYESATPVTQTWSGYICGDPFRESWTLTQIIESSGTSNTQTLTMPAFAADQQPVDYGGYLQIEAVTGADESEPAFRLFLGDSEPEQFEPQSQRIPVQPRWSPESCA
jgi:hypothetical protein